MSEYDEVIFCPNCNTRTVFNVSGSGQKGICMDCGKEIKVTIEGRIKGIMDFLFATICPESNKVDK